MPLFYGEQLSRPFYLYHFRKPISHACFLSRHKSFHTALLDSPEALHCVEALDKHQPQRLVLYPMIRAFALNIVALITVP